METIERETKLRLTPERIEDFLESQRARGRTKGTIAKYRADLTLLYDALPEDKQLGADTLARWQAALIRQGYAPRTVNARISAANSLVAYLGRRDFQLMQLIDAGEAVQPALTRSEYLRLLQTARLEGKERLYLLIKLFGTTGFPVQELERLTVEGVHAGRVRLKAGVIHIPDCLRAELLDYAARQGVRTGAVFMTRNGTPLLRTNVTDSIRKLCRDAQVPPEKGNPRCLKRLYQSTVEGIEQNIALLVEQAHDRLLEKEQCMIGWTQDG